MPKKKRVDVLQTLKDARHHIDTKWIHGEWFTFEKYDDPDTPVVGVCAAGSVLYAMGYTDEQWAEQESVRPVIEALYDALPPRSKAKKDVERILKSWETVSLVDETHRYNQKLDGVISYNDSRGRSKADVLAMFDRAIENVQAATPPVIQELAL